MSIDRNASTTRYPIYARTSKRLNSFYADVATTQRWRARGIGVSVHELARSGFFYSGVSDITICFSCGLALTNWRDERVARSLLPLFEHLRWNANCVYALRESRLLAPTPYVARTRVASIAIQHDSTVRGK